MGWLKTLSTFVVVCELERGSWFSFALVVFSYNYIIHNYNYAIESDP